MNKSSIIAEIQRRLMLKKVLDEAFPEQLNFILDQSKNKAAMCTRRSGKSLSVAIMATYRALEQPNTPILIVGQTRQIIKSIHWDSTFPELFRRLGIKAQFHVTDMKIIFDNGSTVKFLGIDSEDNAADKILGQKYKLCALDEAAFYSISLEHALDAIIRPTLLDLEGQLVLISTASFNLESYFYKVTENIIKGWSVHKWSLSQNPHVAKQWALEKARMLELDPQLETRPYYQVMYGNKWVILQEDKVMKFDRSMIIDSLPIGDMRAYSYNLSIDLGFNDATAFLVTATRKNDRTLYVVDAQKQSGMDIQDVAERIQSLNDYYNFDNMIVDPASKQVVESIVRRYGFHLIAADKRDKKGNVMIANSEMAMGHVKYVKGKTELLIEEQEALIWDKRILESSGAYIEKASCENHLNDCFLYIFRFSYNYLLNPIEDNNKISDPFERMMKDMETSTKTNRSKYLI